jgi:hypothetical protein
MPENEAPKVLHLLRITAPPERAQDLQFNLIYRLPVKPVTLSEADVNDNVIYIDIPSGSPVVQHIVDSINKLDSFDLTGFVFETVDYDRETGEFRDVAKVPGIDYSPKVTATQEPVNESNEVSEPSETATPVEPQAAVEEPVEEPTEPEFDYAPEISESYEVVPTVDTDIEDVDDAHSIEDDVEVIADKIRENDERIERAEDEDEKFADQLASNNELGLSYVSTLDIEKSDIQPYLLPEFAATKACEVVADSVENPILATNKRDLLRNVREVSMLSEDDDENSIVGEGVYETDEVADIHLKFLRETSKLSREFANDRSKVQDMDAEEVDKLLNDIQDKLYPEMNRDFDNADAVRVSVKESIEDMNSAIVNYRLDYLDEMKQVMEKAALDAAIEYAEENRKSVLQACSDEMLLNTYENAATFGKSTSQVISMLLKADCLIDMKDDISDELRAKYHALLAVAQYRALSDKAMAEMVCELTEKRAAEIEESYATEDADVDIDDVEDVDTQADEGETDDTEDADEEPSDTEVTHEEPVTPIDDLDVITDGDVSDAENLDDFGDLDFDTEPEADLGGDADVTNQLSPVSDDLDFGEVEDEIDEPSVPGAPVNPLSKKEQKKLEREKKKAERAEKRKNRKPLPLAAKIGIGVATALVAIAGAGFYFFNMSNGAGRSVESTTDPRGQYQVGDSYVVNVKGSDGKAAEKNLTISKFVDSPDDSKDAIIAVDKDGKEYRISYDKMQGLKKAEAQNADTASNSQTSTDGGSQSTK